MAKAKVAKKSKDGKLCFHWSKDEWTCLHHFRTGAAEGSADQKELLGGKGANLAEMCNLGLPVPAGFTIDTETCFRFTHKPKNTARMMGFRVAKAYAALAKRHGFAPLVSVRSGAAVSMPGMMDTIPNVGLTSANLSFWRKRIGDRTAFDCRRRLIEEFGAVVAGIERKHFTEATTKEPREMNAKELEALCSTYEGVFAKRTGSTFPDDVMEQLNAAIVAVFKSWGNARAREYRKMNGIPETMGTAVNVQTMVFGNAGDDSGTGVLFTRNPATGANEIHGEFLQNAQGEDVVAGTATPLNLTEMPNLGFGATHSELIEIVEKLEAHYNDMQDIEFTIEGGKLWMLQTRTGKRSAEAAFRIASDMVDAGRWGEIEALAKVTPEQYAVMQREVVDPGFSTEEHGTGLPASPGFASGVAVFSNEEALAASEPCVLVRDDTDPDDLPGMNAAVGILTGTGGATSHAAVVARAIDTPCVTGYGEKLGAIKAGDRVTIDGSTGRVWINVEVPTTSGTENEAVREMVQWGYDRLGVMYQSGRVERGSQRVTATEWVADDEARDDSLEALAAMEPGQRGHIILDVRGTLSFRREEDAILWNAFGEELESQGADGEVVKLIDLLIERKLEGTTVTLESDYIEHAERLEAAGYRVGREVTTLADLLHSSGPVEVSDEFIENVVGGSSVYKELVDTFKAAGKAVTPMPKSMTPAEVVTLTFGR